MQQAEALLQQLRAEVANFPGNLSGTTAPAQLRAEIAARLGVLLVRQNHTARAIGYLAEAIEFGAPRGIQMLFCRCMGASRFIKPDSRLKALLLRAYAERWYQPAELARVACSALAVEPAFVAAAQRLRAPEMHYSVLSDTDVRAAMTDRLLLALLNHATVPDDLVEGLLTSLRRILVHTAIHAPAVLASVPISFCAALANQCFANDYAFAETEEERDDVTAICTRLCSDVHADRTPRDIALVASYRALHELPCAREILEISFGEELKKTIGRQIREPLREKELEAALPKLTHIIDPHSVRVQKQYEESPYPRWAEAPPARKRQSLAAWLAGNLPGYAPTDIPNRPFKLLVAGCGTGMEVVTFYTLFQGVMIEAFDLSARSLAFAARKISELGLGNIYLAQADLLELEHWSRRYDVVAASGVLHHLEDPIHGWRVLANLVNPGGHMLVALYSEAGRRDVTALSNFARQGRYGVSPQELRRFRADVLALPHQSPLRHFATGRDDFFNLSMLRDMVFHVSEQRFTIPRIGAALEDLKLEFCGFMVDRETRLAFERRFGEGSACSLRDWEKFEHENPGVFSQMYHFVARKPR